MKTIAWAFLVLAPLVAACGSEDDSSRLTDPNTPIRVSAGQEFTITMESNATTGYSWRLAQPLDETRVTLVGSRYEAPSSGLPGAGGVEIWTFRAVAAGSTVIHFEYVRPWEAGVPPARTLDFTVEIR